MTSVMVAPVASSGSYISGDCDTGACSDCGSGACSKVSVLKLGVIVVVTEY